MTGKTMQTLDDYEINEVQLFGGGPLDAADVILVRRRQRDGKSLWAIYDHNANLNRDGEWELEPPPSSRDDDFIQRCRFSSPEEALAVWRKLQYPTRFWRYYPELNQEQVIPKRVAFTFDERSRITEDEAREMAESAGLTLPKLPLCTCGHGGGPSPAHRGDCPMRIWE